MAFNKRGLGPLPGTVDFFTANSTDPPDGQADDLYQAEYGFMSRPPPGEERFADAREAERWLASLVQTPEFVAAYPQAAAWVTANPVMVQSSSDMQTLHPSSDMEDTVGCSVVAAGEIILSEKDDGVGLVTPVLIHEFAHIVHGASPADSHQQAHGPEFAAVYLDMVTLVYGDETADMLLEDFGPDDDVMLGPDDGFGDDGDYGFAGGGVVRVDRDARRVTDTGDGLIAAGRLPRASRRRNYQTITAARRDNHVRQAEEEAAELIKRRRGDIKRHVNARQKFFEQAVALGADLPRQVQRHLTPPPKPKPKPTPCRSVTPTGPQPRCPSVPRPSAVAGRRRLCNRMMPRARRRCVRTAGHRGGCS